MKQYEERHRQLEIRTTTCVTKDQFDSYKDTTQAALKLAEGKTQGIGLMAGIIYSVIVATGVAFGMWASFGPHTH